MSTLPSLPTLYLGAVGRFPPRACQCSLSQRLLLLTAHSNLLPRSVSCLLPKPHSLPLTSSPAQTTTFAAGEKGSAYAFHAPGGKMAMSGSVPVLSVKVADTTGAGDAYLSGFVYYMLLRSGLDSLVADPQNVSLRPCFIVVLCCAVLS